MQAFYRLIRKTKTFLFKISMEDKLLFLEEAFYKSDKFTLQVNISRKEGELLWN